MSKPVTVAKVEEGSANGEQGSRWRWSTVLVWAGALAVLALLGWGLGNTDTPRPQAGAPAPAFEMEFFDGYEWQSAESASLEEMEGQVVVLNFWASWCVECRIEADLLESAWREYRDDGVIFLGVAYLDVEQKSLDYLEEFNVTYPNAPDLGSVVANRYQITGVPETFFIGKDGQIADVVIGPVDSTRLHTQISRLLTE
ncbi:MAG: TlpA disulfide reductase family protein [Candidatus Promineifilaceae bacterium]|nr:TlpA disulfide reductase family protein [Candidatus Promineifilaceae bacterium]